MKPNKEQEQFFEEYARANPSMTLSALLKEAIVERILDNSEIYYEQGRAEDRALGACNMKNANIRIWLKEHLLRSAAYYSYDVIRKEVPDGSEKGKLLEDIVLGGVLCELNGTVVHELVHRYSGESHSSEKSQDYFADFIGRIYHYTHGEPLDIGHGVKVYRPE